VSKLPIISGKIVVRAFIKIGYKIERQRGSHIRLSHLQKKSLTVPNHKVIGKGLLRKLLRNAGISVSEFITLLKN
jgi:predicted RNA binding protein YcfA (HicA-like mRNA interferase family)